MILLSAAAGADRVEGIVIRVGPEPRTMLVSHKAIAGRMPAMTMEFRIGAGEKAVLRPGARVTFEVRGAEARRIEVFDGIRDLDVEAPREKLPLGAVVPGFVLTDHTGAAVSMDDFRGRLVLVNFLYTRCPMPEVCPRLAAAFASLQRRFRDRMGGDLILLSITVDPGYDTPEVLARYAKSTGAGAHWRFLTGSPEEIRSVAARFGLVYWAEEGVIVHNSTTAIIGRDGTLQALVEGSSYRLEQLRDLVSYHLGEDSKP